MATLPKAAPSVNNRNRLRKRKAAHTLVGRSDESTSNKLTKHPNTYRDSRDERKTSGGSRQCSKVRSDETNLNRLSEAGHENAKPTLPTIDITGLRLREKTERALNAMRRANRRKPRFLQRGGVLVRLRVTDGNLEIQALGMDALLGELDRVADWWGRDARGFLKKIHPPQAVVKDILNLREWPESAGEKIPQ